MSLGFQDNFFHAINGRIFLGLLEMMRVALEGL
jgi:hypothetical protein